MKYGLLFLGIYTFYEIFESKENKTAAYVFPVTLVILSVLIHIYK